LTCVRANSGFVFGRAVGMHMMVNGHV